MQHLDSVLCLTTSSDRQGQPQEMVISSQSSNSTSQKGRPLNIHFFGGMDLPKLYTVCTPEKHWQTVLVNAESVSHPYLLFILSVHENRMN